MRTMTDPMAEGLVGRQRGRDEDNQARCCCSWAGHTRGFEEASAEERHEGARDDRERGKPSADVVHRVSWGTIAMTGGPDGGVHVHIVKGEAE
jgi:hypothetical protein